jgi:hypothetical protein
MIHIDDKEFYQNEYCCNIVWGIISLGIFFPLKAVYAHTLSGGESAAFLALVKILQADSHLVQSNIASDVNLTQAHANAIAEHLDANTTKELAKRNKLVAHDLTKAISDLNQTVQSKPTATVSVVKAISDIINETLERYREAYGIEEGTSMAGHNAIVNMADYQSAQAIAAKCSMR